MAVKACSESVKELVQDIARTHIDFARSEIRDETQIAMFTA